MYIAIEQTFVAKILYFNFLASEDNSSCMYPLKVIPQNCIAHPYCARFLASLTRAHSARTLTTWRFLYETKPAREIKGHFLLSEHGDLSFFLHNFDEIIIFFEFNEF